MTTIGVMHPGEMGAAIAAALVQNGHEVGWASHDRSVATRDRAEREGLKSYETLSELAANSEALLSICPPNAAVGLARKLSGFKGMYIDANAISPASATEISRIMRSGGATYVDGGIVGPPPSKAGATRLYLSGPEAPAVAELFAGTAVQTRALTGDLTAASALKMAYAAWTKGSSALLLAVAEAAERLNVGDALRDEWETSQAHVLGMLPKAQRNADEKGWRWTGEMEEIAATFEAVGIPGGFHRAAAEIYAEPSSTE